jgi:hypothetical protein
MPKVRSVIDGRPTDIDRDTPRDPRREVDPAAKKCVVQANTNGHCSEVTRAVSESTFVEHRHCPTGDSLDPANETEALSAFRGNGDMQGYTERLLEGRERLGKP